jgi:TP901 family phage tail tape measure protein
MADATDTVSEILNLRVESSGTEHFNVLKTGLLGIVGAATAATAAIGASVKVYSDWNSTLDTIQANTGSTSKQMAQMNSQIMALGRESPASLDDLAKGFERAANMGYRSAEGFQVVQAAMKAAVNTGGDVETMTTTLASVMANFKIPASEAAKTMDVLAATAQQGNLRLGEFAGVFANVGAAAKASGVSMNEAAAALVAMTKTGMSAQQAAKDTRALIQGLTLPTAQATQAFKDMSKTTGVDLVGDIAKLREGHMSLKDVLADVGKATGGNSQAFKALFPTITAWTAATRLAGSGSKDFSAILDAQSKSAGNVSKLYQQNSKDLDFLLGRLKNIGQEALIGLGSKIAPALSGILDSVVTFATKLSTNPAIMKIGSNIADAVGSGFRAVGQAIGAAMSDIGAFLAAHQKDFENFGKMVQQGFNAAVKAAQSFGKDVGSAISGLGSMLSSHQGDITKFADSFKALSGSTLKDLGSFLKGIGDDIGVIGTQMGKNLKNSQDFSKALADLANSGKGIVQAFKDIVGAFDSGGGSAKSSQDNMKALADFLSGALTVAIKGISLVIDMSIVAPLKGIATVVNVAVAAFKVLETYFTGTLVPAIKAVGTFLGEAFNDPGTKAKQVLGALVSSLAGLMAGLAKNAASAISDMASAIVDKLGSLKDLATASVSSLASAVVGFFASLPGKAASALGSLVGDVLGVFGNLKDKLGGWMGTELGAFGTWAGKIPTRIGSGIAQAAGAIKDALVAAVTAALDAALNYVKDHNPFDWLKSHMPSLSLPFGLSGGSGTPGSAAGYGNVPNSTLFGAPYTTNRPGPLEYAGVSGAAGHQDIQLPSGTPFYLPGGQKAKYVLVNEYQGAGYGNTETWQTPNGGEFDFMHMNSMPGFAPGGTYSGGTYAGLSGGIPGVAPGVTSAYSTGAHLHVGYQQAALAYWMSATGGQGFSPGAAYGPYAVAPSALGGGGAGGDFWSNVARALAAGASPQNAVAVAALVAGSGFLPHTAPSAGQTTVRGIAATVTRGLIPDVSGAGPQYDMFLNSGQFPASRRTITGAGPSYDMMLNASSTRGFTNANAAPPPPTLAQIEAEAAQRLQTATQNLQTRIDSGTAAITVALHDGSGHLKRYEQDIIKADAAQQKWTISQAASQLIVATVTKNLDGLNSALQNAQKVTTDVATRGVLSGQDVLSKKIQTTLAAIADASSRVAEIQAGVSAQAAAFQGDLSGMSSAVTTITGILQDRWQAALVKTGDIQNQYAGQLLKGLAAERANETAAGAAQVAFGLLTHSAAALQGGFDTLFKQVTTDIGNLTGMLGRGGTTDGIGALTSKALTLAQNFTTLSGIIQAFGTVVTSTTEAAQTEYARTGSVSGGTVSAIVAATAKQTAATWDQVGATLQVAQKSKDLIGYYNTLGTEITLEENRLVSLGVTQGTASKEYQAQAKILADMRTEYAGLGNEINAFKTGVALIGNDATIGAAALAMFATGVDPAVAALSGMTQILDTSALDIAAAMKDATAQTASLGAAATSAADGLTTLVGSITGLVESLSNIKTSGSITVSGSPIYVGGTQVGTSGTPVGTGGGWTGPGPLQPVLDPVTGDVIALAPQNAGPQAAYNALAATAISPQGAGAQGAYAGLSRATTTYPAFPNVYPPAGAYTTSTIAATPEQIAAAAAASVPDPILAQYPGAVLMPDGRYSLPDGNILDPKTGYQILPNGGIMDPSAGGPSTADVMSGKASSVVSSSGLYPGMPGTPTYDYQTTPKEYGGTGAGPTDAYGYGMEQVAAKKAAGQFGEGNPYYGAADAGGGKGSGARTLHGQTAPGSSASNPVHVSDSKQQSQNDELLAATQKQLEIANAVIALQRQAFEAEASGQLNSADPLAHGLQDLFDHLANYKAANP